MVSPLKLLCRLATAFSFLIITTTSPITAQEQSGTGWYYDGDSILTLSGSEVAWKELDVFKDRNCIYRPVRKIIFAENYNISAIPDSAFHLFCLLKEIAIPEVVTEIGNDAFSRSGISIISLPDNLTSIGERAFYGCSFSSIKLPNGITSIKKETFYACDPLASVTLPKNLISIEDGAFSFCFALSSITIPNGVTSIGHAAFGYCENLASVSLSDSLKYIARDAFFDCKPLTSIVLPASLTYIGGYAFDDTALQSVEILSNGTPDNKHVIFLGHSDPAIESDKTDNGDNIFPIHQATLIYDPNTTWIGDDDTQNLRYYFKRFAHPTSISTPTDATTSSTPQFFDLNGRPVSPSSHKGLTIKRQDGHSSLISTK